uniref:Uncharacterized protein n=1 Tax=Ralstonia syzygii R24 TaxID=907261 RepID=G3A720_9RALS|nr:exported hypothetical protein [Ralstonia syzygii R24]
MSSTAPTTLVVCLIVACVVVFAFSVYWLFRRRPPVEPYAPDTLQIFAMQVPNFGSQRRKVLQPPGDAQARC